MSPKKPSLRSQIEVITTPSPRANELLDHVEEFLKVPLPEIKQLDLTSQESAQRAVKELEALSAQLQQRSHIAQTLKRALSEESGASSSSSPNDTKLH